jgi:hypothetical protein
MRRIVWRVGFGVLAAGAAAVLWFLVRPAQQPAPALPAPAEVDRILVHCPPFEGVLPETGEFPVPPAYVADILRVLGPPTRTEDLARYSSEVATLRVACRNGREVLVRVYFYGKEPARYSIDGVHCLRGGAYQDLSTNPHPESWPRYTVESHIIALMLRQMEHQPMPQKATDTVRDYLFTLDRSAGRTTID